MDQRGEGGKQDERTEEQPEGQLDGLQSEYKKGYNGKWTDTLKEHCHRDFCWFWFNSAKITTFCLLSCKTMLLPNQQDNLNSNEILVGRANHNNFVGHFSMHREEFWKCFQISIHFHPRHLWWHTGVFSVNAVLQSLAAKLDHYFKVSTDALAVLSFLKWW